MQSTTSLLPWCCIEICDTKNVSTLQDAATRQKLKRHKYIFQDHSYCYCDSSFRPSHVDSNPNWSKVYRHDPTTIADLY